MNLNSDKNNSALLAGAFAAVFLLLIATLAIRHTNAPTEPVAADAPDGAFSSGRAMAHLKHVAAEPHPIGSPANQRVRDYLLGELARLGVEPAIQKTQVERHGRSTRFARFATVENVIARLPGTDNSKALLLMSHYDSVPNAHGATDDGAGVVAMLETLRALKAHPPLKNDVIFLFTDGEEIGLMGAKAFVDQHPSVKDVGLVLDFEGSGSSGQVIMFETSEGNGRLIAEFARAAPAPIANSLSYEIYRRMPNDTDFTMFRKGGYPGLNFAFIDDRFDYHTNSDNIDNISEASVQHHGSYALALTLHFGNLALIDLKSENAVYFNPFGAMLTHYSEKWILPFALLALAGFVFVMILGFRAGKISLLRSLGGLVGFIVNLVAVAAAISSLYLIIVPFFPDAEWYLLYYNHRWLLIAFVGLALGFSFSFYNALRHGVSRLFAGIAALAMLVLLYFAGSLSWISGASTIAAAVLVFFIFRKGSNVWNLTAGSLFGWAILMMAVSLAIPGGSWLVTWPFLFSLVPLGIFFWRKNQALVSMPSAVLFSIFAAPAVYWFANLAYLLFISMGLRMSGFAVAVVALLMGLLTPLVFIINSANRWLAPTIAAGVGVVFLLMSLLGAEFDERYRKPNSIFYAVDADAGEAFWAGTDDEIDDWTAQFLSATPDSGLLSQLVPTSSASMWKKSASLDTLAAPRITVISDSTTAEGRALKMHLASGRKATDLHIFFKTKSQLLNAHIDDTSLDGLEKNPSDAWYRWRYFAIPPEGIELTLHLQSDAPLEMQLTDVSYGLPQIPGATFTPRPKHMMPRQYTISDMTLVTKKFKF